MPMSTINERIQLLISHFTNGNKRAFANKLGLSATVIENVVGKRGGKPSFDVLEKIAFAFATVNTKWLLTGTGTTFKNTSDFKCISNDGLEVVSEDITKYEKKTESERIKELRETIEVQREYIALLKSQIKDQ